MSWRDLQCGEAGTDRVGERLTLAGWASSRRDHGGLVFIDLRDRTGVCQLVVNPERAPDAAKTGHAVRTEYVLQAEGELVRRAPDAVNPKLPTGEVELLVDRLEIVSTCEALPFQLDEDGVDEAVRLRWRYLDLRRAAMQRNLRLSSTVVAAIRRAMEAQGFLDIWTPNLLKPTPEGARDFVVPVRLQPGKFFALPQSPQMLKQILMIAGFDRYYQIATCFRDEDLRADRQFEFRQLDLEMAFVEQEDVHGAVEIAVCASFEALGRPVPARPFPRLSWAEAMRRYGSDKPDLRFGCEIADLTDATRASGFRVLAEAPCVRAFAVPSALARSELDRLTDEAKALGAKGLAYLVFEESGEVRSPIAKFLGESELEAARQATGAGPGSTVLFGADEPSVVAKVLGALRLKLGHGLGLVDPSRSELLWIVDFPLFLWDEDAGRFGAAHHPFTGVAAGQEELIDTDPAAVVSQAYDLVWNGVELGSGSIRIHRPDVQAKVFRTLGLTDEEAEEKFGFLLRALRMGAPPHGGFALGIDRFAALLAGESNIREVIAFPKTASGSDLMSGAPTTVGPAQLDELGVRLKPGLSPPT
ncbi:MAG: aspartate--tRNA ligase [Gaiellales bacterium]